MAATIDTSPAQFEQGRLTLQFPLNKSNLPIQMGKLVVGTVLFADIVASTAKITGLDPETAGEMLDEAVEFMRTSVHRFGGTVASVQGDGIMAVFGAPDSVEDHALRACCAAAHMFDLFASAEESGVQGFHIIRAGIHSGSFLTRVRSNDIGIDFNALGPVVNIAGKAEKAAPAGSAVLTEETVRLAGSRIKTDTVARLEIGAGQHIQLYKLDAVSLDQSVEDTFASESKWPFVGRLEILHTLSNRLLETDRTGDAHSSIIGEAGAGKSRLLFELALLLRSVGIQAVELKGYSFQRRTPLAPLKPLTLTLLDLAEASDGADVVSALDKLGMPRSLVPGLLEIIELSEDEAEWHLFEGLSRRRIMFDAFVWLVTAIAREQPLVIFVEDVHNMDSETVSCLEHLRRKTADAHLTLVVTSRPQAAAQAVNIAPFKIELPALTENEARRLASAITSEGTVDAQSLDQIIVRAEGNPLFLTELCRTPNAETSLTIENLVQARLVQLSDAARHLVRTASVLGEHFEREVLAHSAGVGVDELDGQIQELAKQDLLDGWADGSIRFKHELFCDGVRRTVLKAEALEIHRSAVTALLSLTSDPTGLAERLAYHCEYAGWPDQAITHLGRAIRRAVRNSAMNSVMSLFDWAIRLGPQCQEEARAPLIDIVLASLDAMHQLGNKEKYENALSFAVETSLEIKDKKREALARAHRSLFDWLHANHKSSMREAKMAVKLADECRSLPVLALAKFNLACAFHAQGNLPAAIENQEELINALDGQAEGSRLGAMLIPSVRSRAFVAYFLIEIGHFERAQAHLDRADQILHNFHQPYSELLAQTVRGYLQASQHKYELSIEPFERARNICFDHQFFAMESCISGWLASALVQCGDWNRALEITRLSVDKKLFEQGGSYGLVHLYNGLAEASLASGRPAEALKLSKKAVSMAKKHREPVQTAIALHSHGHLLAALARANEQNVPLKRAQCAFASAIKVADKLGLLPVGASCHHAAAELAAELGSESDRAQHLAARDQIYEQLELKDPPPYNLKIYASRP